MGVTRLWTLTNVNDVLTLVLTFMASIWKHPKSKYWTACFTDKDGRRLKRSTKETSQVKARSLAEKMEQAYRTRISEATARKLISEVVSKQLGERIATSTPREFAKEILARKRKETSPRTLIRYEEVITGLIEFLGDKADDEIQFITRADLGRFRDREFERYAPSTVNLSIKIVKMFFRDALVRELIDSNPALSLTSVKKGNDPGKRPFTIEEIKSLMEVASLEWKGIILFGLYSGQRLSDIVSITFAQIDIQNSQLSFLTKKTGRRVDLPLLQPLQNYIAAIPASDDPTAYLFPNAAEVFYRAGRVGPLSAEFRKIMVACGLVKRTPHRKKTEGQDRRRKVHKISFHSLRHTATSMLKNSGVSDAVARDIIGHDSAAVSASYTHIDMDTKRSALGKLPEIQ